MDVGQLEKIVFVPTWTSLSESLFMEEDIAKIDPAWLKQRRSIFVVRFMMAFLGAPAPAPPS